MDSHCRIKSSIPLAIVRNSWLNIYHAYDRYKRKAFPESLTNGIGMLTLALVATLLAVPQSAAPSVPHGESPPQHYEALALDLGLPGFSSLIRIALERRPEIQQRRFLVDAARGDALQASLYPNPMLAYVADEIGAEGSAGQQGVEIAQTIPTGGKLARAAELFQRVGDLRALQIELARWNVSRDVASALLEYIATVAEERLANELVELARQQVEAVRTLVENGAATRPELLQAEIEYRQATAELEAARVRVQQARQVLAATVGVEDDALPTISLPDGLPLHVPDYDVETVRRAVFSESPAMQLAEAVVHIARARVQLEIARAYPDVVLSGGAAYDDSSDDAIASASFGVPLRVFDRNQGAIAASRARLAAAETLKQNVALQLKRSFAKKWAEYVAAREQARRYEVEIVAQAEENLRLAKEAYTRGQVDFLRLLVAQRTLFNVRRELLRLQVEALRALAELRYLEVPEIPEP